MQTRVQPGGNFAWEHWRYVEISASLMLSKRAQRMSLLSLSPISQRVGTRATSSRGREPGPCCRRSIPKSFSTVCINQSMVSLQCLSRVTHWSAALSCPSHTDEDPQTSMKEGVNVLKGRDKLFFCLTLWGFKCKTYIYAIRLTTTCFNCNKTKSYGNDISFYRERQDGCDLNECVCFCSRPRPWSLSPSHMTELLLHDTRMGASFLTNFRTIKTIRIKCRTHFIHVLFSSHPVTVATSFEINFVKR